MRLYYLIFTLAVFSCEKNSEIYSVTDVKMYADCTRTANKKTALLLTKDGCRACEIIVRKWNDYYSNSDLQVLPINTSLKENELFNKLSQNYAFPLIIIDDSLIVHGVIAGIKDKKT
ncbi:MAG: hypothetical protein RR555_11515 [Bacteroidales bacterium]